MDNNIINEHDQDINSILIKQLINQDLERCVEIPDNLDVRPPEPSRRICLIDYDDDDNNNYPEEIKEDQEELYYLEQQILLDIIKESKMNDLEDLLRFLPRVKITLNSDQITSYDNLINNINRYIESDLESITITQDEFDFIIWITTRTLLCRNTILKIKLEQIFILG